MSKITFTETSCAECPCCGGEGTLSIRLGEYLRIGREVKEWSRAYAAKQIGISPSCLWKIEAGVSKRPQQSTLLKMLEVYGLITDGIRETIQ